jgi:N6-L-threonylcarbamoyladenine synthase
MPDLDYSFSGIKTSILYFLRDEKLKNENFIEEHKADLAASIQHALVDTLMQKLIVAAKQLGTHQVAIAGGVSANSALRASLEKAAVELGWQVYIPAFEYCTDNAGMIAMAGHFLYQEEKFSGLDSAPDPRYSFSGVH